MNKGYEKEMKIMRSKRFKTEDQANVGKQAKKGQRTMKMSNPVETKQTNLFSSWATALLGFALLMLPAFAQAAGPVIEVLGVDGNSITHNSPATVLRGTDFGDQAKDSTITRTFTIRNGGDSPLLVDGFRQFGDNGITFSVPSETLESGETNTFTATFCPESLGSFNTKCRITATDENYDDVEPFDANFAGFSYSISATNGPYGGGNQVDIEGASEGTVTSVTVGGKTSTFTTSNNIVRITMPKADEIGAVDIVVVSSNLTRTLDYTYVPQELTISNFVATNKVYDGTTAAFSLVSFDDNREPNDMLNFSFDANFADSNVATGKVIGISHIVISGASSTNYTLVTTHGSTTADITLAPLTVTAENQSKTYDKSVFTNFTASYSGLVNSESTTVLGGTLVYSANAQTLAGTYTNTPSGLTSSNYDISFVSGTLIINKRGLTIGGTLSATDKIYDGTTTATGTVSGLTITNNLIPSDTVTLDDISLEYTPDKTVGINKTVQITSADIHGVDSANYTLSLQGSPTTTASITPKTVTATGLTALDRFYDNTTKVTITGNTTSFTGVIGADEVTMGGDPVGSIQDKNRGRGKPVTVSGLSLSGADAGNYVLAGQPVGLTVDIFFAKLTVDGLVAQNKEYDGTTSAVINDSGRLLVGVFGADVVSISNGTVALVGSFEQVNVGANLHVTTDVGDYELVGADKDNYEIDTLSEFAGLTSRLRADITKAALFVGSKPTASTITYGQMLSDSTLTGGVVSNAISTTSGMWAWDLATRAPNAGTNDWSATFTANDSNNYQTASAFIAVAVSKANVSNSVVGVTVTYDGSGHSATGSVSGLYSEDFSSELDLGISYTNVPGGTAHWAFSGTTNYNSSTGSVQIVINQATPTASLSVSNTPVTYSGGSQTAVVVIVSNSVAGSVSNVLNSIHADAGAYVVTASFVPDSGNYQTLSNVSAGEFVINQAMPTATLFVTNTPLTYTGGEQSAMVGVSTSSVPGSVANVTNGSQTDAGTYVIKASFVPTDAGNYVTLTNLTTTNNFVITKATPTATLTITNTPSTYTGNAQSAAVVVRTSSVSGSVVNVLNGTKTNVGSYAVTADFFPADSNNYVAVTNLSAGNFLINKADATVNVGGVTVTYDGSGYGATGTVTGANGDDLTSGLTLGASFTNVPGGIAYWSFAGTTNYNSSTGSVDIVINKAGLTLSGLTAQDRSYDQTTLVELLGLASATLSGAVGGDTPQVDRSNSTVSASIQTCDSGINKLVTVVWSGVKILPPDDANYSVTGTTSSVTVTVDPRWLKADGLVALDKVYDATTDALIDNGNISLEGVLTNDVVSIDNVGSVTEGTFATANVGTSIAVTPNLVGVVLSGADASNYRLNENYDKTLIADITEKTLTVVDLTGVDKVYDRSTNATASGTAKLDGVISPDVVNLAGTGVFNFVDFNVASNITVNTIGYTLDGAQAGNYSLTQPTLSAAITPKPLDVIGLTGDNKVYDGGTNATANGTTILNGVVIGDAVTLNGTPVFNFVDPNVGTNITINTAGYVLSGAQSNNYSVEQPTLKADITPAELIVTADGKSVTYGDVKPVLTYTITAFVNNETTNVVSGSPMLSTTYTNSTVVSNSPVAITVTAGTLTATNYTFAFSNGVITVGKAELLITPANTNVTYGDAVPALIYELTGFKNSDTTNDVSGAAMLATTYNVYTAVSNSPVAITASNGTLVADNYSFVFTNGLVIVGKAELLVTPGDTNVTYGAEAPEFTYSLSGFKNLESTNVVSGAPTLASTYQAGDSVTHSPLFITATSNTLAAANYLFGFTNGLLTIDKAGLLVSADDKEVTYGETATGLTYTISGFVLQETASVINGTASNWTTYVAGDSVTNSPVDIMVTNGDLTATNYSFAFTNGLLTVKAADGLSIEIVNNPTKTYDSLTAITNLLAANYQLTGFVYSNESFIVTQPNGTFENKNIGTNKSITVSLASSNYAGVGTDLSNYVLPTNAVGTGAIVPAPLSVSVINNPSKVYDGFVAITNLVTTNYVVNGLVPGDSVEINQTLGEFTNKNVVATNGVVVLLTVSNYTPIGSTDLGNYQLPTQAMGVGSITPAELSVYITNNPTKLANGTTVAILVPTNFVVEGLVLTNEGFTVTQTNGLYASEKAGVHVVTATLSSSDFSPILATLTSNYSFPTNTTGGKTGTILPNVLNQFVVSGIADPIAAGVTGSVTVTAYDAYDNLKTDYTGAVTFVSSDTNAAIVLPGDYSFMESDSGMKTFSNSVMLATVGNCSVSAIDSNAVITGSQTNIVVTPGAVDHVTFLGSSSARAGQGEFITATVRDRFENVATYYTGSKSVHFSGARESIDPVVRPFVIVNSKEIELGSHANVSFTSGTLSFETVFYKAETANLRLTLNTDQKSSEGYDLAVEVTAGNSHKILWVQQPASTVNKDAQWNSFSLEVTDYWANRTDSSKAVTITPSESSFSGGTNPSIASNGLVTFSDLTYGSTGTVTLVASASGLVDSPQSDEVIVESIRVIVTFDQQGGGSPVPGSKEVVVDAEYGTLAAVTKAGSLFKGWYTQPNQGGSCILGSTIVTIDTDHTLYAGWESLVAQEYTLSIAVNPNSVEVTFNPSDEGCVYELQVRENLTSGSWTNVGVSVDGPDDTLTDTEITRSRAYYRVIRRLK